MKKLTIFISILLALGMGSCTEWLDLRPENETVLEDFWQTESQATSVLAGCYRGMIRDDYMSRIMVWGELRSDNIVAGTEINDDMEKIIDVDITPSNQYANWGAFYSVINYCNTFLYYAPDVVDRDQNFTATKLHTMEAEAKAIRALTYFYLVRAFNEVPLVLTPSIDDEQDYDVPKSTEREILDQIIDDLKFAQQYAKTNYGSADEDKGRITLSAVNSILADVYLWDEQYANCVEACNNVLSDETLKLEKGEDVLNNVFFEGNSTESIFELQFDKDIQYNNLVKNLYGISGSISGDWAFALYLGPGGSISPFNYEPSTLNESSDDIRLNRSVNTISTNNDGYCIYKYVLQKYSEDVNGNISYAYRTTSTTPNWIVYRLSDVMLMKAEALTQLDRDDDDLKSALKLVNTTYLRSNLTADSLQFTNYPDKESMQSLVLRERQRELLFEGKRWFDLLRYARRIGDPTVLLNFISPKLTGDNMQLNKLSVMESLYMPILQAQIDINPNLVQNSFYIDSETSTSN